MRKIAIISEHASPLSLPGGVDSGGQNVYVGEIAKHLAAIGYDVDVFTRRDSELLPSVAEWVHGVRIIHVPAGPPTFVRKEEMLPYMEKFTTYVCRFFKRQRRPYDLIHANFWMSGLVAAELKRALGVPFVVTFHALGRVRRMYQGEADEFPDARFAIEDRIVAEADHIIAECPQEEEDLIRLYNADPAKITIIPGGFDPEELFAISKPLARATLGFAPDERVVLQLGRMVPRKGVDNVIRGFARLLRDHKVPARLLIVGGESEDPDPRLTPEIGRLQSIVEEEGVKDEVTFAGRRGRDMLKYYYSAADIFVTTPWYEPFGITAVEAMGCGTPVIGSEVGGIKFTVRDGETGYLVPPNDPDALAERLAHLYKNSKLLNVFGRRAVRRANDLFTWQRIAQGMAVLYEGVIAASRPERHEEADHLARLDQGFEALLETIQESRRLLRGALWQATEVISGCLAHGGKALVYGHGPSAASAQRFATMLLHRPRSPERPGLPVIALNADGLASNVTNAEAAGEHLLLRQLHALGQPGDVFIGVSAGERSSALAQAFELARRRGLRCVGLLRGNNSDIRHLADVALIVPSGAHSAFNHELQLVVLRLLGELVQERLLDGIPAPMQVPLVVSERTRWDGRRAGRRRVRRTRAA